MDVQNVLWACSNEQLMRQHMKNPQDTWTAIWLKVWIYVINIMSSYESFIK